MPLTAGCTEKPKLSLLWAPPLRTLTRQVAMAPGSSNMPSPSASRSWTKISAVLLVSPGTRSEAQDSKATKRPSALIEGLSLSGARAPPIGAEAWPPSLRTLTWTIFTKPGSSYTPSPSVSRSRTKISRAPLVSFGTRFVASDAKATYRPSALMEGAKLSPSAALPFRPTLIRLSATACDSVPACADAFTDAFAEAWTWPAPAPAGIANPARSDRMTPRDNHLRP